MELIDLKGIGLQTLKKLNNAGIVNIEDLLSYYPRDYIKYDSFISIDSIKEEKIVTVRGEFINSPLTRKINGRTVTSGKFSDGTGRITVSWYSMPYIKSTVADKVIYLRGKVIKKGRSLYMYQPSVLTEDVYEKEADKLLPIYPLKAGLTVKLISKLISECLNKLILLPEYLPEEMRNRYELAEINYAIRNIHFPETEHDMLIARRRLVFDEFFFFMLSIRELKEQQHKNKNYFKLKKTDKISEVIKKLGYNLTNAQNNTLNEIIVNFKSNYVMNRLIQGDVGSGKTIIAVLSMICAADNNYQSALMAPTEVLAMQHYEEFEKIIKNCELDFKPVLLTGSMSVRKKREVYKSIEDGEADFIIGTHALIQEKVVYNNLALVITDEQHRFGVRQRAVFSDKANVNSDTDIKPHVLVMSATPIPRTLALILYGDLDISVINEMPANRIPIKNCVVDEKYLANSYRFIEKEVAKGRQAYVICPMVDESDMIEAENVTDYAKKLQEIFPANIKVGVLHGKMKPSLKNEVMKDFADKKIDVLVSTTVIEVGINVPNATVMMIENANRFGLSQLHQLRGRVGRGEFQSYCIFIDRSGGKEKNKRLSILEKTNDGFKISAEDLKLRGPGDFYGTRQNGQLQFNLGDIYTDAAIIKQAKDAADIYYEKKESFGKTDDNIMKKFKDIYNCHYTNNDIQL